MCICIYKPNFKIYIKTDRINRKNRQHINYCHSSLNIFLKYTKSQMKYKIYLKTLLANLKYLTLITKKLHQNNNRMHNGFKCIWNIYHNRYYTKQTASLHKFQRTEFIQKTFSDCNRITQEINDNITRKYPNLWRVLYLKEIESAIKNFPPNKQTNLLKWERATSGPNYFIGIFLQAFLPEITYTNSFQEWRTGTFSNSFYEDSITLTPKAEKYIFKKIKLKIYISYIFKILNKILAVQI